MSQSVRRSWLAFDERHLSKAASRLQNGQRFFTHPWDLTTDSHAAAQDEIAPLADITLMKDETSSRMFLNARQTGQSTEMLFAQTAEERSASQCLFGRFAHSSLSNFHSRSDGGFLTRLPTLAPGFSGFNLLSYIVQLSRIFVLNEL